MDHLVKIRRYDRGVTRCLYIREGQEKTEYRSVEQDGP
jgi:hypothetical protein